MRKKDTVYFAGTFDILNAGHCRAIARASDEGKRLTVGVNSDELVRWFKGREPIIPFEQRVEIVKNIKGVFKVVKVDEPAAINFLRENNFDVYVVAEEWKDAQVEAISWMRKNKKKVVYTPRWKDILCSSEIRSKIIEEEK